jgi:hypothetical protein
MVWPNHKIFGKKHFDNDVPKEEISQIVIRARPYTLYDEQLYKLGSVFYDNAYF